MFITNPESMPALEGGWHLASVDVRLDRAGTLTIEWQSPKASPRRASPEQLRGVQAAMAVLHLGERMHSEERARAALMMISRSLWELLDGPGYALIRAIEAAERAGRRLLVIVRALADDPDDLRTHPAAHMAWQLLPHSAAESGRRFAAVLQLGPRDPGESWVLPYAGLRVLAMASAPEGVPALDHELEEERLLAALSPFVAEDRASVRIVEGGTREDLARAVLLAEYDVVLLSGHGLLTPNGPRLVMEDSVGRPCEVSPPELFAVFDRAAAMPPLVVLSSCSSAEALGALPSFAAELVAAGVSAVLGWTRPIRDDLATAAIGVIVEQLAAGKPSFAAVEAARNVLRSDPTCDAWTSLVLMTRAAVGFRVDLRGSPLPPMAQPGEPYRFLGNGGMTVLQHGFVGRRRPLQRIERMIRDGVFTEREDVDPRAVAGLMVWGMKGVGKSCLVARALERVGQYTAGLRVIVLHGAFDDGDVFDAVRTAALPEEEAIVEQILSQHEIPLLARLQQILGRWRRQPVVFLLDDFEQNLEARDDDPWLLRPRIAALMEVLLRACRNGRPKLLITTTAIFEPPTPYAQALGELRLGAFELSAVRKLWVRGPSAGPHVPMTLRHWEALAARFGHNARILGWARLLLASKNLDELAVIAKEAEVAIPAWQPGDELREAKHAELAHLFLWKLAHTAARASMGPDIELFLQRARVYEVAVPLAAFVGLAEGLSIDLERDLVKLANFGLLEVGNVSGERAYRVSPLVEPRFVASEPERWHAVASTYWWNISQIAGVGYHVIHVHRAWRHACEGHHQGLAEQAGRVLISALTHQGRHGDGKLHADTHLFTFPGTPFALFWAGEAEARAVGPSPRAAALLNAAIEVLTVHGTRRQLWVASCLQALSKVLRDQGRLQEARLAIEEAVSIQETMEGNDPANRVATLQVYAELLEELGELQPAELVFERALAICEMLDQPEAMAGLLQALGGLHHNQGRLEKALAVYERVLALQRAIYKSTLHPSMAATYHQMGLVLSSLERYEEARRCLDETLRIKALVGEPEFHPGYAKTLQVYSTVLAAQGDLNGALDALDRALRITRQTLKDEAHPNIAAILHSRCGRLLDMRRLDEALDAAERCLAIERRVYPEPHPRIAGSLIMLGAAKLHRGDLAGARAVFERAREMYVEIHGTEEHPGVAGALHNLAYVCLQEKNPREAVEVLRRALFIHERCHGGGETARTAATEVFLAAVLLQLGQRVEGERRAKHALGLLGAVNPRHPSIRHLAMQWPDLRLPGTSRRRRRGHRPSVDV